MEEIKRCLPTDSGDRKQAATTTTTTVDPRILSALDRLLESSRRPIRCCLYPGSFDPFHLGHLEVARVVLEHALADIVIIAPNNRNASKFDRSELDFRCKFAELAIDQDSTAGKGNKDFENVLVSRQDVDVLVRDLDQWNKIHRPGQSSQLQHVGLRCGPLLHLSAVMGDDQLRLLLCESKRPKLQVTEWYIVPRMGWTLSSSTMSHVAVDADNKIVTKWQGIDVSWMEPSWFAKQTGSSTEIRTLLGSMHDDIKTTLYHPLLTGVMAQHLMNTQQYSRRAAVRKLAAKRLQIDNPDELALVCIKDQHVFLADDKWIVKCFFGERLQADLWNHEVSSYDWLLGKFGTASQHRSTSAEDNLVTVRLPAILSKDAIVLGSAPMWCLIMSREGRNAEQVILAEPKRALEIGHSLGAALARIHSLAVDGKIQEDETKSNSARQHQLKEARGKWSREALLKRLIDSRVLPAESADDAARLVDGFCTDAGTRGYVHGDASLSNFVIPDAPTLEESKGQQRMSLREVVVIDCAGIAKFGAHGVPAYEYCQMLSSIRWRLEQTYGKKDLSTETITGFQQGYKPSKSTLTAGALALFSTIWNVGDIV
jgi:cytidyltransferase-like protein